jgi:hypothetical protein
MKDRDLKLWQILLIISPIFIFPLVFFFGQNEYVLYGWFVLFISWLLILGLLSISVQIPEKGNHPELSREEMLKQHFYTKSYRRIIIISISGILGLASFIVMFFGAMYITTKDDYLKERCEELAYRSATTSSGKIEFEVYEKDLEDCVRNTDTQSFVEFSEMWLNNMHEAYKENQEAQSDNWILFLIFSFL